MNIKDYYERIYNYTHGLTESAESQTNDSIQHSAKGKEWDKHKYLRKEYLGNGNWKYIYEDSEHVSTAANETEADAKELEYQTMKPYNTAKSGREAAEKSGQQSLKREMQVAYNTAQSGREAAEKSGQQALKNEMRKFTYNTAQANKEAAIANSGSLVRTPIEMAQQGREAAMNNASSLVKTPLEMAQGGREAAINNSSSLVYSPTEMAQKGREAAIANSGSGVDPLHALNTAQAGREADIAKSKLNETRQERYAANMANQEAAIKAGQKSLHNQMGAALNTAQQGREAAVNGAESFVYDTHRSPVDTTSAVNTVTEQKMNEAANPVNVAQSGREAAAAESQQNYRNMITAEDAAKAKSYADKYMNEMENLYNAGIRAGLSETTIMDLISTCERNYGGTTVTEYLMDANPEDIEYQPGSGAQLEGFYNNVLPKVRSAVDSLVSAKDPSFSQNINAASYVPESDYNMVQLNADPAIDALKQLARTYAWKGYKNESIINSIRDVARDAGNYDYADGVIFNAIKAAEAHGYDSGILYDLVSRWLTREES